MIRKVLCTVLAKVPDCLNAMLLNITQILCSNMQETLCIECDVQFVVLNLDPIVVSIRVTYILTSAAMCYNFCSKLLTVFT